jgi:RNA polymerase sigma-70 factor (ECF subfamily)
MIVLVLPDIPTEDALLARARAGDQQAIMEIYEAYYTPIYQFIRLRVGDVTSAEDIASDVFVKFVTALKGRSAPRKSLRGWLFQVARNELNDHYGKNKRMPTETLDDWIPAPVDETNPERRFMQTFNIERLRQALRMLAPEQQEVIIMRFGQALSLQETADVMDKSVSAIKSLQFRAVSTLRDVLGEFTEADNG